MEKRSKYQAELKSKALNNCKKEDNIFLKALREAKLKEGKSKTVSLKKAKKILMMN